MNEKILVTASDAAQMLSIGRSTFFKKVTAGQLPKPVKFGGVTRWRLDELRAVGLSNRSTTASSHDAAQGNPHDCKQRAQR